MSTKQKVERAGPPARPVQLLVQEGRYGPATRTGRKLKPLNITALIQQVEAWILMIPAGSSRFVAPRSRSLHGAWRVGSTVHLEA